MFKPFSKRALIGIVILSATVGCSKFHSKTEANVKSHKIDAAAILGDANLSNADKAEKLAKASEQLLTVQGFAYASDVADAALQLDPANLRAQFVKALLAPILVQKGIVSRIAPLMARDPQTLEEYNKSVANMQTQWPNSTFKSFLFDGAGDIQTEADAQAYGDALVNGFETLRQFARANKDKNLTVMASDTFYQAMLKRFQDACIVNETDPYQYTYDCPSMINLMEITLSRADFEGLQQMTAGYELYFALANSYQIDGSIQTALNHRNDKAVPSAQKIINELLQSPKFATLRAENGFQKIKAMGVDAVTGIHWVLDNQNSLCPLGSANPRNRLGALFSQGFCVAQDSTSDIAQALIKASSALNGGTLQFQTVDKTGTPFSLAVKPVALMDKPIPDLRVLTPLTFDACDNLTGVADGTIGGILPNGDANKVLPNATCYR